MQRGDGSSGTRGASEAAWTDGPRRSIIALLVLVTVFWLMQVLGGTAGRALDAFEYHYPSYVWLYGEIAQGRLPLWNPHQLCGIPTLGTLQSGVFYPPHLLHVLLPTHVSMAISGLLHLWIVGVSTWALVRRAGLGIAPALVAGLLVAMRGAQPGHVINPGMQEASAWIAVGFIGVLDASRGRPLHGTLWIALATGMSLLAGFPQSSVYSAYAWGVGAVVLGLASLVESRRPRALVTTLASLLGGVGLGALVAAVVLWPALDLAALGSRERGLLPLALMLPYGRVGFETVADAFRFVTVARPASPQLLFTFGVAGLGLALCAPLSRRARTLGWLAWLLGALALVFALGPATPFFDLLIRLPELGSFRSPWRVLFVADFAIAVAAAVGLDALLARFGGAASNAPGRALHPVTAIAGLALAVVLLESMLAPGQPRALPYSAEDRHLKLLHEPRPALDALARRSDRVLTIFGGDLNDLSEKVASVVGFRSIGDNEILALARQREYFTWLYWGTLEPEAHNELGHRERIFYGHYDLGAPGIDGAAVAGRNRLAELAAARRVLVARSVAGTDSVLAYLRGAGVRSVDVRDPDLLVLDQPRALPRAILSHAVAKAPPVEALLAALSRPDFDPRTQSYVEAGDEALPSLGPRAPEDHVEIVEDEAERVVLRAWVAAPALVVLADTWHPAWEADVDGQPAPIWPTNHLFRGVVVPAGEHTITFRYRPAPVVGGAWLSTLGLAACAGLAVAARRETRDEACDEVSDETYDEEESR